MNGSRAIFPRFPNKGCPKPFLSFFTVKVRTASPVTVEVEVLSERSISEHAYKTDFDSSLFFTNLPRQKRQRKVKHVEILRPGKLLIECKRKQFDHYSGNQYDKNNIPLASKSWSHKKSKGDYFTMLTSTKYSPFPINDNHPNTFQEIGISKNLIQALKKIDVECPTLIQSKALQCLLSGMNVLMAAECGSGKTLAYLIAMVENILQWKGRVPRGANEPLGVVLLPTTELIIHTVDLAVSFCRELGINCRGVIYPRSMDFDEVDILVCSPQVLYKLILSKIYSMKSSKYVAVDDAHGYEIDEKSIYLQKLFRHAMWNFTGFDAEIIRGNSAQICFATACASKNLSETLSGFVNGNPLKTVSSPYLHKILFNVPHKFYRVGSSTAAVELLKTVRSCRSRKIPTIIFSNRKDTAIWIEKFLWENSIDCGLIHQGLSSEIRLMVLRDFENGAINFISSVNMLALGLNFPKLQHVVNFELPTYMVDYIYRCGRVGRLNQKTDCFVTNFVKTTKEIRLVNKIETAARLNVQLRGVYYPHSFETY